MISEGKQPYEATPTVTPLDMPVSASQISSIEMEGAVVPVTKHHKAAHRRLIYTDNHGLIEVPSNLSWVVKTKPPFSQPLIGTIIVSRAHKRGRVSNRVEAESGR